MARPIKPRRRNPTPDTLRGHPIYFDPKLDGYRYCDTDQPTAETWQTRPCGYCGRHVTPEGHDGCIGTLPNVMNACCGHGEPEEAYVQFDDGRCVRGAQAIEDQRRLKCHFIA